MPPPFPARRVVTTVATHADPKSLRPPASHPRKFAAGSRLRSPSPLVVLCAAFALLALHAVVANLSPPCAAPPSADLTAELERWRQPQVAAAALRVFVYDLPPRFNVALVEKSIAQPGPIRDPRCDTNFYSAEVHVHRWLLASPIRTADPEEADFFYVPVYTTCDLITHQPNDVPRVGRHFAEAMDVVIRDYPYWNRSSGRDHVYMFSQGFSARLAGDWQRYANGIFMVHNGEFSAPEYTPHKDFTIPPELKAYFTPYWIEDPEVVVSRPRQFLAQFGGQVLNVNISDHRGSNYSGGVRQYIQAHFSERKEYQITGVRTDSYIDDMKNSKFCLSPEGWHPWSPRPYYAVMMGCIPVVISEVQELAFEELVDWDSFVVWIRPADISHLDDILHSFSETELKRRQLAMKATWRALWYADEGLAYQSISKALYSRKYDSAPVREFSRRK
ncbi:Glycosyltransferase, family GT47 [Chondrus crispus]|uniref:Glycosyltransferase, family GT47 n=1 Tax=Chondrus crispus TaxID=2769 RepID=R7QTA7_CHOCR|nr:Glycosyltransferase, family GT47 [Chondrus crispus]CDF40746.1 Glycosyltransferase, family GT47 [Chondrus crispus]|eukprot:XP_005711040.1 Glycosyltransferase, family GT47 [Chondrus crispus]